MTVELPAITGADIERFCDMGTWYVLPEFRSHSIRLIKALLAQDSYHFTALTPSPKVVPIHTRLGFHPLDTSAALIANSYAYHGRRVSERSAVLIPRHRWLWLALTFHPG